MNERTASARPRRRFRVHWFDLLSLVALSASTATLALVICEGLSR